MIFIPKGCTSQHDPLVQKYMFYFFLPNAFVCTEASNKLQWQGFHERHVGGDDSQSRKIIQTQGIRRSVAFPISRIHDESAFYHAAIMRPLVHDLIVVEVSSHTTKLVPVKSYNSFLDQRS